MSKEFKTQDYFRYKRLGKRWRKPVGWQSKLRLKRGGSGRRVSIGYGSPKEGELDVIITVRNVEDVVKAGGRPIRIASAVGAKNTLAIVQKAKDMDSRIVNAKKAKRALRLSKELAAKNIVKKKEEEKKKELQEKEKKEKAGAKDKKAGIKSEKKTEATVEGVHTKSETKDKIDSTDSSV